MEKVFTDIYDKKRWGTHIDGRGSSGPGSRVAVVKPYVDFLNNFFALNHIVSVVDIGCGDWQFSKHMDWSGKTYLGVDVVKSVIDYNQSEYTTNTVKFQHADFTKSDLPSADVYLVKDVLQHVDNASLTRFLDNAKCRYLVITNCWQDAVDNQDNKDIGQTRPLSALKYPLKKWNPVILGHFSTKEISVVTKQVPPQ